MHPTVNNRWGQGANPWKTCYLARANALEAVHRHFTQLLQEIPAGTRGRGGSNLRSEEHTSELQSLMRISYAVFCLKKKKTNMTKRYKNTHIRNTKKYNTNTTTKP